MLFNEEMLEVVPEPGKYALVAFLLLGTTVSIIFYFMRKSLKRTNQHFDDSNN